MSTENESVEAIKELTKSVEGQRADLQKQQDELKDAHRQAMDAISKGVKLDKETQTNIDAAIAKANDTSKEVNALAEKIDELKKAAARNSSPLTLRESIAKELDGTAKVAYEALKARSTNNMRLVLKDITSADVSTGMKREPYIDSLVSLERQPLRIADLMTTVPVQSDAVKYGKQTVRTNAAAVVAEQSPKPYSTYKWESDTVTIDTIAHLAKLTMQALEDAPRLAAEVEAEMRYGYALKEEAILIDVLQAGATPYAVPLGMDGTDIITPLDKLRVAILQVHLAHASPDAHVLNPINMAEIDLMRRDTDQNGGYLFSRPDQATGTATLWRLPAVESASMGVAEFLTGAFKYASRRYLRSGIQVAISTENDTDFETNEATMRVEGRMGAAVIREYALVGGYLTVGS